MIISVLVAMDLGRGIGKDNHLPWRLPSDLKRFKALTMGHHLIMGRKTFESIGRILPGRDSIVITRNPQAFQARTESEPAVVTPPSAEHADKLIFVSSLEAALRFAQTHGEDEAFVIGGGEIFRLALPSADRIYLTIIQAHLDCDTFFPEFDPAKWEIIEQYDYSLNGTDQYPSQYQILQRNVRRLDNKLVLP